MSQVLLKVKPRRTSKSEQSVWETCPAQWNYNNSGCVGIAMDDTPLRFGTSAHAGIAGYQKEMQQRENPPTPLAIQDALNRNMADVGFEQQRVDNIIKNVMAYEVGRLNKYGPQNFKPILVEQRIEALPFKGYVDLVHATDKPNEVVVVDWKTGRYNPTEWQNTELSIYCYLVGSMGYKPVLSYINFVEHGMLSLGVIDIPKAIEKAYIFFKRTENPYYHYPKKRGFHCRWCAFQIRCFFESNTPIPGIHAITNTQTLRLFDGLPLLREAICR